MRHISCGKLKVVVGSESFDVVKINVCKTCHLVVGVFFDSVGTPVRGPAPPC